MTLESAPSVTPPVLAAVDLHKAYPGIKATDGVTLELHAGTVHGLVGVNGAGKSTVLKIVTGVIRPDRGTLLMDGEKVTLHGPHDARMLGIAAVHQEPSLVPGLDAVANVFLGQQLARIGVRREREMREAFASSCAELGLEVPPTAPAREMPLSIQQQVEIMRALQRQSRVLVLDEPTAALGIAERAKLMQIIEKVRSRGTAVLFISHHLDEVLDICDEVTVLRSGKVSARGRVGDFTRHSLTSAIVGRSVGAVERRRPPRVPAAEEIPVLDVTRLRTRGHLRVDLLRLHAGEVIGLAGLVGSGRTTFLRALAGLGEGVTGEMRVNGLPVTWPVSPRDALAHGIALAPEDRRTEGLVLSLASWVNIAIGVTRRTARWGLLRARRTFRASAQLAEAVGLTADKLRTPAATLSGGNQQKVVLGRLLGMKPRILLIDEPMRGIDVGAKDEIFQVIERAAAEGAAVVIASEETEDLLSFCDRVIVMRKGRAITEVSGIERRDEAYRAMLAGSPHEEKVTDS